MMTDYIRREDAIKYAENAYHEWNLAMAAADGKREINLVYKRQELCKAVESVFRDMPAADVAEVVHEKWLLDRWPSWPHRECSRCKIMIPRITEVADQYWQYCPNCGAKMDGGNEGE